MFMDLILSLNQGLAYMINIHVLHILFLLGSFVITGGLLRIVSGMGTGVTSGRARRQWTLVVIVEAKD